MVLFAISWCFHSHPQLPLKQWLRWWSCKPRIKHNWWVIAMINFTVLFLIKNIVFHIMLVNIQTITYCILQFFLTCIPRISKAEHLFYFEKNMISICLHGRCEWNQTTFVCSVMDYLVLHCLWINHAGWIALVTTAVCFILGLKHKFMYLWFFL